ncbi:50S ribosomal protein L22 [Picrophilus oshimae]|uniref:Large ribosomal subunit protein uL22 n=2 Tax=Picrophilus torridus (strain ATCC 700027 / DSM 9790 / JCM 10055 / NBRC 100828 / KAW 2/3) TaxID=1122961 RepID=RL22_PICTO|nr:50S ribosomal protein L22 [Picrophilus oshimae]Q6L1C2.1 RecName: Full=Large ribosomal subunit protein uL22; AltName: Full=50S ribosomal protein L22 [Picrophilus oshimae DSM 9789]AAT43230.1 large subunit ribosomal protein L22P [Picrophilus oshimae DSM 9789]
MKGYSIKEFPERSARARIREIDISLKDAVNVAHFLKGMDLDSAKNVLDNVIEKKVPVPYFRYMDSVSHRKGIGPGRYPVKAARAFKKLLEDVSANAEFKGLSDSLEIVHIAVSKGRMIKKYTPKAYGRAGAFFKDLVNLEVVVRESGEE